MSKVTRIEENDLQGLPEVISRTLEAHPGWERVNGKDVCAGADCDWIKPPGKVIKKRYLNHQTFELQWAIGLWYDGEEEAPE